VYGSEYIRFGKNKKRCGSKSYPEREKRQLTLHGRWHRLVDLKDRAFADTDSLIKQDFVKGHIVVVVVVSGGSSILYFFHVVGCCVLNL